MNIRKKPLNYFLTVETPQGTCRLESDNWRLISSMVGAFNYANSNGKSVVDIIEYAQEVYRASFLRKTPDKQLSVINRGVEKEVIRAYLYSWTIEETIRWIASNKNVKLSKSAIGRFFTRLRKSGVLPLYEGQNNDVDIILNEIKKTL